MTDDEILKEAKAHIKTQYMVELRYLVKKLTEKECEKNKTEFIYKEDRNKLESLACRLTKGIQYIRFEGHTKDDIWIRQEPNYELKLLTLIIAIAAACATIYKAFHC